MRAQVALLVAALAAGSLALAPPATGPTTRHVFEPVADQAALHNAHVVIADKLVSGAQPEGDASFEALRKLGVKTIISVDGAKPDVERATKYGMRYVHLPIGYDGVSPDEGRAIAKALAELPGPTYLHCHHGKHRSAAAVAVACVYNGSLRPEQAEDVLRTFGTGANYKGLWAAARNAAKLDAAELAALQIDFVEAARVADLAQQMVAVDHTWDRLKLVKDAGWKQPADHPDLDPAHEALQLGEHFAESARLQDTADRPDDYRAMLKESTDAAAALQAALRAQPFDAKPADEAFARVGASCKACHVAYRD